MVVSEVSGKILMIGLLLFFVFLKKDLYWIFGAVAVEGILYFLIMAGFARQYFRWKLSADKQVWKETLKRSWPIALSICFNLIYLRTDTIILSLTRTTAEVGLYSAAYRIIDVLTMLPAVFMGLALPVITKYFSENRKAELNNLLQKSFDSLLIFTLPIIFGVWIIGRPLMALIGGNEFVASGDILKVLIVASGFIFMTSLFTYSAVGIKKQKSMMIGFLLAAVLTLAGYLMLIPKYGVWAASGMTVFSELFVMIWSAVLVCFSLKFKPNFGNFWRIFCASIFMASVLYWLSFLNIGFLLIIATVAYFAALYLLGGIQKSKIISILNLKN